MQLHMLRSISTLQIYGGRSGRCRWTRRKARRVDTLQYQIEELKRAKLKPGEEEELTARRGMLRNAEKFLDAVAGADYALNGDDSGGGALSALRQAQDALSGVRHLDDAFGQLYERLGEAYSEVYDIAATVEDKRGELDVSPGELDRVESRMDLLYRLKRSTARPWRICWTIRPGARRNWRRSRMPVTRWRGWSRRYPRRRRRHGRRRRRCPMPERQRRIG